VTINVRVKPSGEFTFVGDLEKDPEDVVDLIVDYTQYYKTDSITTITVTGTNITIDSSSETDNILTIFISGGTTSNLIGDLSRRRAKVKIKTQSATRTLERTVLIKILEK